MDLSERELEPSIQNSDNKEQYTWHTAVNI